MKGIKCGRSSYKNSKGWFKYSEDDMVKFRAKGTSKLIREKRGIFSQEFIEANKERLRKSIKTPDGEFDSMGDAASYYGVCNATITYRMKNFDGWYFVNKGD